MNKDIFDSMRKQMNPSPEVRAALEEKLAQPVKRRIPVRKYVAVAACAALVIGGLSVYSLYQDQARWMLITQNFHRDGIVSTQHIHSYVLADESATAATGAYNAESGVEDLYPPGGPDRGSGSPNIEDPASAVNTKDPAGGDIPAQEGAEDYQDLRAHLNGTLPDWYGGAYLDADGYLVVLLVESQDPGDKSLELQIQNWTDSDRVRFGSAKYSLAHLIGLMDQLNQLPNADLKYADVMVSWVIDEEHNRIELTLTQVYEPILSVLAELDPEDDAIYVQVSRRAAVHAGVEDSTMRGGAQSDPRDAVTYDVETGEITIHRYPYGGSESLAGDVSGGTAAFDPDA